MDHSYALRDARAGGDCVGAPPPPPPPPPAAAMGIDYGAGGDYVGAPGPPAAIRLVQEGNVQIELSNARVDFLRVLARLPPDEARRRLRPVRAQLLQNIRRRRALLRLARSLQGRTLVSHSQLKVDVDQPVTQPVTLPVTLSRPRHKSIRTPPPPAHPPNPLPPPPKPLTPPAPPTQQAAVKKTDASA